MKKYLFVLINLLNLAQFSTIKEIVLIGNELTTNQTILNHINHHVGDIVNIDQAIEDQLNLYNTGLFYDVIIQPTDSIYYIYLFEKPKILPQPRFNKHDVLGWSYGASILFNNINGENKKLNIGALTGKTTIFDLHYTNPNLPNTNDSLNIKIYKTKFRGIEDDYKINRTGITISINAPTKNPHNEIKAELIYEFNSINFIKQYFNEKLHSLETTISYKNLNNSNKLQKRNIFTIDYSFIKFKEYYKDYNKIKINNNFIIPFVDNHDLGRIVIVNQCMINFSDNIPIYNKVFLNNETIVRGYDPNPLNYSESNLKNRLKWNNIISATIQIELPLFKKNTFKTEFLLFIDYGIGANKYHDFDIGKKLEGFGLGVRYEILRLGNVDLCIGINPFGEKNFHAIANFKSF